MMSWKNWLSMLAISSDRLARDTKARQRLRVAVPYSRKPLARPMPLVAASGCGVGKSYLACALTHKACREHYRALYYYAPKLFR